jgi:hypothetical protein
MAIDYGQDTFCVTDVPLIDTQVTDPAQLVGQRVARSLQTPRGSLAIINGDPNRGYDVRGLLLAKLSPQTIAAAQAQIENECLQDEQVQTASAVVTSSGGNVVVSVSGTLAVGPFAFTLTVQQLTAQVFFANG